MPAVRLCFSVYDLAPAEESNAASLLCVQPRHVHLWAHGPCSRRGLGRSPLPRSPPRPKQRAGQAAGPPPGPHPPAAAAAAVGGDGQCRQVGSQQDHRCDGCDSAGRPPGTARLPVRRGRSRGARELRRRIHVCRGGCCGGAETSLPGDSTVQHSSTLSEWPLQPRRNRVRMTDPRCCRWPPGWGRARAAASRWACTRCTTRGAICSTWATPATSCCRFG